MNAISVSWKNRLQFAVLNSQNRCLRDLAINCYGFYLQHKRFNQHFWEELKVLESLEEKTIAQQQEIQSDLLAKIVRHAYEHSPFYRRRFAEYGVNPSQIQNLTDLQRIPILTREDIQSSYTEMIAMNVAKSSYTMHHTSGTTGTQLVFAISNRLHWTIKFAHLYRHYAWAGIAPGVRRVTLGGRSFTQRPPYWTYNRWENQLLLSIHHMNVQTMDSYVDAIVKFAPVFVQGHPSGLARLGEHMLMTEKKISLRAVFTTGETLSPDQRRTIKAAFDCPVFDFYGQGEGLFYAGECEQHRGLHEFSRMGIIELTDHSEDGTATVVGTSLHNYAMPMLRYRLGDLAVAQPEMQCPCGRGYPLKLAQVIGRVDDRIYLSKNSNDYLLPVTIRMHVKPQLLPGQTYQLRQRDIDQFDFLIVSPSRVSSDQQVQILKTLRHLMGAQAQIDVQQRDSLATRGGKIRNVVSDLKISHPVCS